MTKRFFGITSLFIISVFIFTCPLSCTSNQNKNVYFIHAVGARQEGDMTQAVFLVQKQSSQKDSSFSAISISGKDIEDAAKKMRDRHRECYFATTKLYLIPADASNSFIQSLSSVCHSGILPSACNIICTDSNSIKPILEEIGDSEALKKLASYSVDSSSKGAKKNNAVHFFAKCLSDSGFIEIPYIQRTPDGKTKQGEKVLFPLSRTEKKEGTF